MRVLKHSEPILLAGIPESTLLQFIAQYTGKRGDAKLEIGSGGLDAISGATVTVIAENQVISRSAYEVGRQVGIFKGEVRPPARYTALSDRLSWQQLLDEGSVVRMQIAPSQVGLDGDGPYLDMYFGHLNVPSVGISLLGEPVYRRLMADLKPDEQAIFIIGGGQTSFKGSGFVRGGIYDRIQVRQDPQTFTFRDTDYLNLYGIAAQRSCPRMPNRPCSSCVRPTSTRPGLGSSPSWPTRSMRAAAPRPSSISTRLTGCRRAT
ncbi:hypothetical protein LP420_13010 [Massilia sp. B-10]|nr:hypothetical protein LP420_13010 [Massilia sp. B-10]